MTSVNIIPDADAEKLLTSQEIIDYVAVKLNIFKWTPTSNRVAVVESLALEEKLEPLQNQFSRIL